MDLVHNIVIDVYSILLLVVINFQSLKNIEKGSYQNRLYIVMLHITMLLLVLDIFSRFDGRPDTLLYPIANWVGNFLIFLFNPILPSLWILYVYYEIFRDEVMVKQLFLPLIALNVLNVIMVVVTQFTGLLYYIDDANIYHRSLYGLLGPVIPFLLMLFSYILIIRHRERIDKRHLFSLAFFPAPPIAGMLLQIYFYGLSIILNSIVLSLLIVLLNIQNQSMITDYLTGIHNRKRLEAYLRQKISTSSESRSFSLVMLDIDNFKHINDTFGHDSGDLSLRAASNLLQGCIRSQDFIARFGGDEFCLILDISDEQVLEATLSRINQSLEAFNHSSFMPFQLHFSMGYDVYDYRAHVGAEEFLKQVDLLMYENKKMKKDALLTP